jgi:ABC-type multidrug transport system fused ATPase/permease subunit
MDLRRFVAFSAKAFAKHKSHYLYALLAAVACSVADANIPYHISSMIQATFHDQPFVMYAFYAFVWNVITSCTAMVRGALFTYCNHKAYYDMYQHTTRLVLQQPMDTWDTHGLYKFDKLSKLLTNDLAVVVYDSALIWNMLLRSAASFMILVYMLWPLDARLLMWCMALSGLQCALNHVANMQYTKHYEALNNLKTSINGNTVLHIKDPLSTKFHNLDTMFDKFISQQSTIAHQMAKQEATTYAWLMACNHVLLKSFEICYVYIIYSIGLSLRVYEIISYLHLMTNALHTVKDTYIKYTKMRAPFHNVYELLFNALEREKLTHNKLCATTSCVISFQNVSFAYPSNPTRKVIRDLSFSIAPREKVILQAPNGAGKSTIMKLFFKMYSKYDGSIYIGQNELRNIPKSIVHQYISVVPQDPLWLPEKTLYENITLGNTHYDTGYIKLLLTQMGLEGLDLHDVKPMVSGGQRQRVAIIRAILANTPIVFLDEATSAVDQESDAMILEFLLKLWTNKTIVYIAHKPLPLSCQTQFRLLSL